jgi:hypothetical protein
MRLWWHLPHLRGTPSYSSQTHEQQQGQAPLQGMPPLLLLHLTSARPLQPGCSQADLGRHQQQWEGGGQVHRCCIPIHRPSCSNLCRGHARLPSCRHTVRLHRSRYSSSRQEQQGRLHRSSWVQSPLQEVLKESRQHHHNQHLRRQGPALQVARVAPPSKHRQTASRLLVAC